MPYNGVYTITPKLHSTTSAHAYSRYEILCGQTQAYLRLPQKAKVISHKVLVFRSKGGHLAIQVTQDCVLTSVKFYPCCLDSKCTKKCSPEL